MVVVVVVEVMVIEMVVVVVEGVEMVVVEVVEMVLVVVVMNKVVKVAVVAIINGLLRRVSDEKYRSEVGWGRDEEGVGVASVSSELLKKSLCVLMVITKGRDQGATAA